MHTYKYVIFDGPSQSPLLTVTPPGKGLAEQRVIPIFLELHVVARHCHCQRQQSDPTASKNYAEVFDLWLAPPSCEGCAAHRGSTTDRAPPRKTPSQLTPVRRSSASCRFPLVPSSPDTADAYFFQIHGPLRALVHPRDQARCLFLLSGACCPDARKCILS